MSLTCQALFLLVAVVFSEVAAAATENVENENNNIVIFQICSVKNGDKTNFTKAFGNLANLFQENLSGQVEAYALMDTLVEEGDSDNKVAIVQGYQTAADHATAMAAFPEEQQSVESYLLDCSVEVWGSWDETMKETLAERIPFGKDKQVFHQNQDGYIDFCRGNGGGAATNYPNMKFWTWKHVTDVEWNMATLKSMGDFYYENIPGVLAWIAAVEDPNQTNGSSSVPAVVHNFQLFRDIYAFLDHSSIQVYPGLITEIFPGLMGSMDSTKYNGTFVGYQGTNDLARSRISNGKFPNQTVIDFWGPRGKPTGMTSQTMGFMNFCGNQKKKETESPVRCDDSNTSPQEGDDEGIMEDGEDVVVERTGSSSGIGDGRFPCLVFSVFVCVISVLTASRYN